MSDPVTNAEIEDVLSAVRRLVSGTPASRRETPVAEDQGKLVLTPAFRVDPEATDTKTDDVGPEAPFTHAEDADEDADSFAPRDNITSMVQEALTEGAETSDTTDFDRTTGIEVSLSDDDAAETTDEGDDVAASLEARIAELESVVVDAPEQDLEPAEEVGSDQPDEVLFHHSAPDEIAPETPAETPAIAADDEQIIESVMSEETPRASDAGAEDWQDVSDAPFEGYDEHYEDVDPADEDVTLDASAYVRHEEAAGFTAEATTSEPLEDDDDEMVIDEAMLREIVARLVREELQGTMGERITRNLRRMVRREIARALALKEFE